MFTFRSYPEPPKVLSPSPATPPFSLIQDWIKRALNVQLFGVSSKQSADVRYSRHTPYFFHKLFKRTTFLSSPQSEASTQAPKPFFNLIQSKR